MEISPKWPPTANKEYLADTRFMFHCNVKLKLPAYYGEELLHYSFEILKDIDRRYNSYSRGSYFDLINKHAGSWVYVDDDTIELLQAVISLSKLTEGIFDIRLMPLLKLWGFYDIHEKIDIPEKEILAATVEQIRKGTIDIRRNQVRISNQSELLTGAFMKSFAVDKLVSALRYEGINDAMINAGGSTIYALNNEEHPYWTVNIPHPGNSDSIKTLELSNACLSLSGKKNNHRIINGHQYGHVLNAATGMPSTNLQAVAIAQSALTADMLSTTLMANDTNPMVTYLIRKTYAGMLSYYVIDNEHMDDEFDFITC